MYASLSQTNVIYTAPKNYIHHSDFRLPEHLPMLRDVTRSMLYKPTQQFAKLFVNRTAVIRNTFLEQIHQQCAYSDAPQYIVIHYSIHIVNILFVSTSY